MARVGIRARIVCIAVRVQVIDPPAYTPPYDHALCVALARAGAQVELVTSRFAYGAVPEPDGYARRELFYRATPGSEASRLRRSLRLAQHVPDMLRYRRLATGADVVHFQWLSVQHVDGHLLPARRTRDGVRRPLVLTAHDVLPREPRAGQLHAQRRVYEHFDAIVVHSEHGRRRLTAELGVPAEYVHVIPHGVFVYLAHEPPELPAELPATNGPVVLCFGLMRPYKGINVLLEAWREVVHAVSDDAHRAAPHHTHRAAPNNLQRAAPNDTHRAAPNDMQRVAPHDTHQAPPELWLVGMPRMDLDELRASAPPNVRWVTRFVDERELAGCFRRADLTVLPYLQADQSGVLFTALAFGKPLLLSDVGGFPEMADTGAAQIVPAGDPHALAEALGELLASPDSLERMTLAASAAAEGAYSWDSIARAHLEMYRSLCA
jgi:glycosyltransferase involved in cell wall biosynthesis